MPIKNGHVDLTYALMDREPQCCPRLNLQRIFEGGYENFVMDDNGMVTLLFGPQGFKEQCRRGRAAVLASTPRSSSAKGTTGQSRRRPTSSSATGSQNGLLGIDGSERVVVTGIYSNGKPCTGRPFLSLAADYARRTIAFHEFDSKLTATMSEVEGRAKTNKMEDSDYDFSTTSFRMRGLFPRQRPRRRAG